MIFNAFVWVVFGSLTGFLASRAVRSGEDQTAPLLVLGIVGALVGGATGMILGTQSDPSINVMALFAALLGALALISLYKNISPQT